MNTWLLEKKRILNEFEQRLTEPVNRIAFQNTHFLKKSEAVNKLVASVKSSLIPWVESMPQFARTDAALLLHYCSSVASLEFRNRVWPYEYMAFSRRVGELWEGFCSAAWDYPSKQGVHRIHQPDFNEVRETLRGRILENIGYHGRKNELLADIDILFELIGNINMREDEVFLASGLPHVIDFKSGFGSNEKGNMLRLQTVGRAYRLWNMQTRLMLLVRQEENNNYLRVLQQQGVWSVYTGDAAYEQISRITGANIQQFRNGIINWEEDLSPEFIYHLENQPTDLRSYLRW